MRLSTSEMLKFYDQYKADQTDGFISNIDTYVDRMLLGLTKSDIEEIKNELKRLVNKDIKKEIKNLNNDNSDFYTRISRTD